MRPPPAGLGTLRPRTRLTDDPGNVAGLAEFVASLGNVERVDVLPFHTLGAAKYAALGLETGEVSPRAGSTGGDAGLRAV